MFYVEFHSEATGEPVFTINDNNYQYVNARYPDGRIDLGIYHKESDRVMDYHGGRKLLGIDP
jgi:hypothetical protein